MSNYATAAHEKERLQYFASPEGRDDLYQYNQKERRTVLEVMSSNKLKHFSLVDDESQYIRKRIIQASRQNKLLA